MNYNIKIINHPRNNNIDTEEKISCEDLLKKMGIRFNCRKRFSSCLVIIRDEILLRRISDVIKEVMRNSRIEFLRKRANAPDYNAFYGAFLLILFLAERNSLSAKENCMNAAENIMNFTKTLNLSAFWSEVTSLFFESRQGEEFKKKFEIPQKFNFVCSIAVGYRVGSSPIVQLI